MDEPSIDVDSSFEAAEVKQPDGQTFDLPATSIPAELASILMRCNLVAAAWDDQLDSPSRFPVCHGSRCAANSQRPSTASSSGAGRARRCLENWQWRQ